MQRRMIIRVFLSIFVVAFLFSASVQADSPQDNRLSQLVRQLASEPENQETRKEQIRDLIKQRKEFTRQHGKQTQPQAEVQDGVWEGEVVQVVVDMVDAKGNLSVSRDEFHLTLPNGTIRLLLLNGIPPGLKNNARVKIEGVRVDEFVIPESVAPLAGLGDGASAAEAAPACAVTGPQRGLTIAVNWQDDPVSSPSVSTINSRYYGATSSLADYWDEASYGKTQLTGDTLGWFTLNMTRAEGCDVGRVRTEALAIAAQHTDLAQYNRIFIVMRNPTPGCGWAGLGELGCNTLDTPDGPVHSSTHWVLSSYFGNANSGVFLAAHEAGHNITLHHAGVRDYGANRIGPIGDISGSSLVEYGDRYDSMGNHWQPSHYNAVHKHRIGWLTDSDITHVNGNGSVLLDPMSTPLGGVKAARIFRGVVTSSQTKEYLWLETRQPNGYDAFMDTRGHGTLIVHHQRSVPGDTRTENLDMTPGSAAGVDDYYDAPLASGQSFTDSLTGITVTHGGVDGQGRVLAMVSQDAAFVDADEDGLANVREAAYGTNPNLADTDGDGVTDLFEVCFDGDCTAYAPWPNGGDMNALSSDTEGDGLDDGVEVTQYHTNPTLSDTDGDDLDDIDEINTHGTNPVSADTDNDGLSDSQEINTYRTDPLVRDTDGDGLLDGFEVSNGSDPRVANAIEGWSGTITGRVTTADGRGVAGLTFWDVGKYPLTVTTDEDGYFVIRGYSGGQWVWINTNATNAAGYTLAPTGWSGGQFQHDGGAVVARNYIATPKTDTVRGKVRLPNGEPLAGLTFWDVTKYPTTVTSQADGTFVSQGYSSGSWILFNTYNTGSQGYTLAADGWSGGQFQHNGTAMSGYDYVATQKPGTVSGRVTTPDGKPVAGITFWDIFKYPQTLTTGKDGRFISQGYSAGSNVWFNTYNSTQAGYTLVPAGWNGSNFVHDGSAKQNYNFIAVPATSAWNGTVTGRVTTADGRGVAGLTFWDVGKYPLTVTTDEDGYFAIRGYTGGEWVWINTYATNAAGYTLAPTGWSGGQFQHDGGAVVARNYIATPKTDTVRGVVRLSNDEPLSGLTFWDVTKYPTTVTSQADGTFVSQGYSSGSWILFNTYNTGSQGYTLAADGWSGGQFQHNGAAMSGYDYVATQKPGTVSGRVTTPDGKPVAGITFWDIFKYPQTLTTGKDGRFISQGYSAGSNVWFNTYNSMQAGYTLVPAGWNGSNFVHDGSAKQNYNFIAVPITE